MPDPSWNSYRSGVARYSSRVRAAAEVIRSGAELDAAERAWIRRESGRLDEVFAYLRERDGGESLRSWRSRRQMTLDEILVGAAE